MHLSLGGYQLVSGQFCVARRARVGVKLWGEDYLTINKRWRDRKDLSTRRQ